jgi:hypothetical protein
MKLSLFALFLLFAIASAQPSESRKEILRAVRVTVRFGDIRCRQRFRRSLCTFARQLVDLILDDDFVGDEKKTTKPSNLDDDDDKDFVGQGIATPPTNIDNSLVNIRNPATQRYLSVNFFKNVASSMNPFPWTIIFDNNDERRIRIKSDQHNLFLHALTDGLTLRALGVADDNQAWRIVNVPGGEGVVLQNIGVADSALGVNDRNEIDLVRFINTNDQNIRKKVFVFDEIRRSV